MQADLGDDVVEQFQNGVLDAIAADRERPHLRLTAQAQRHRLGPGEDS